MEMKIFWLKYRCIEIAIAPLQEIYLFLPAASVRIDCHFCYSPAGYCSISPPPMSSHFSFRMYLSSLRWFSFKAMCVCPIA